MVQRKCPSCTQIILGRSDKKYCSDQCRSIANKATRLSSESIIQSTNKILRKNRSILKHLCPVGKAVVRKEVFDAMQYDVTVFSSMYRTRKNQIYFFCYDYGFTAIMDKEIPKALIVTRQDYTQSLNPWDDLAENFKL